MGSAFLLYDAPEVPPGTFDEFLAIPAMSTQLNRQTFSNFINTTFSDGSLGIGPMK